MNILNTKAQMNTLSNAFWTHIVHVGTVDQNMSRVLKLFRYAEL